MNQPLIYQTYYHLWRNGEYLGIAAWVEDENIGDSFQRMVVNPKWGLTYEVYTADRWEIVEDSHKIL